MVGITSFGGYVPSYRLNRKIIFDAMGWLNPSTLSFAKGEKTVANFDEDSITLAVAAGRDCLTGVDRSKIGALYFGSTSIRLGERQNAGIIATALNLSEPIRTADFSGSLKAGTTALLSAIDSVKAYSADHVLVCASDCRLGKMGSMQEMIFGDGGAAFVIGREDVIAEFKGSYSLSHDFLDQFREESGPYNRSWEDRWIRDAGFDQFIPQAVRGIIGKYRLKISDFTKVIYPCYYPTEHRKIAKMLQLNDEQVQSPLQDTMGDTGTPQSLIMLIKALEEAKAGDRLLLISFGDGCDALLFEVNGNIEKTGGIKRITHWLSRRRELNSYEKYITFKGIIPRETGVRGEHDSMTSLSFLFRKGKAVLGLCGVRCKVCHTPQYPPQRVCVNPSCGIIDQMEDYYFSERKAKVFSYTADRLAASIDPPAIFGVIDFENGGRFVFDFTDCNLEDISVEMPVDLSFRKRSYDKRRGIQNYFWKAVPRKGV